jgi:E3 ubiquitin-protein ligase listerin
MSKRQFKTQASSSRAASGTFGGGFGTSTFGTTSSLLSYVAEPPDLSLISDPNVVVTFKNLSKKDSTTKAKALEDLQKYVTSSEQIEDAILEAWVGSHKSRRCDHVVIFLS